MANNGVINTGSGTVNVVNTAFGPGASVTVVNGETVQADTAEDRAERDERPARRRSRASRS